MPKTNSSEIISHICGDLSAGKRSAAAQTARAEFPWARKMLAKRSYGRLAATQIFCRDEFIDRYFGSRLIYPGALLLLGHLLPDEFPMHPTWKVSESHEIYWELWPAVDHMVPLSRGGSGDADNLVSTSTLHNNAKGHWLPEELGWKLYPPGNIDEWDGLLSWFIKYADQNQGVLEKTMIRSRYQAAKRIE